MQGLNIWMRICDADADADAAPAPAPGASVGGALIVRWC